jgi:chemotaxis protein MotA
MKRQDVMTLVGLIAGLGMVTFGMLSGGTFAMFIDPASLAITGGGSFCSLLVNYPLTEFKRLVKVIAQSFKETSMGGLRLLINSRKSLKKLEEKDNYPLRMT